MEIKSDEDWLKAAYEVFNNAKIMNNEKLQIDGEKLKKIIELIPAEQKNNQHLKNEIDSIKRSISLAEYRNELNELDKKSKDSMALVWDIKNFFTIKNSIFSKYTGSKKKYINEALDDWIHRAEDDFKKIQDFYELSFYKSIDELELAKMELRELNNFFERGSCNSLAINQSHFILSGDVFSELELYDYYLSLLRGEFEFFIDREHYSIFKAKGKHTSFLEEPVLPSLIQEMTHRKEADSLLSNEWWLSVRVQALLWLRMYLNYLISTENFNSYQLSPANKFSIDDLIKRKYGFQIVKPNKSLPVFYNALIENNLIKDEGEESFKSTFQDGVGAIKWIGAATHGKGVNSLIYLIDGMYRQGLIKNENFIKITASIFRDKEQQVFKHSSLTQSNSANIDRPPKNKLILDNIIEELKSL